MVSHTVAFAPANRANEVAWRKRRRSTKSTLRVCTRYSLPVARIQRDTLRRGNQRRRWPAEVRTHDRCRAQADASSWPEDKVKKEASDWEVVAC
jgi:hypothetical protein